MLSPNPNTNTDMSNRNSPSNSPHIAAPTALSLGDATAVAAGADPLRFNGPDSRTDSPHHPDPNNPSPSNSNSASGSARSNSSSSNSPTGGRSGSGGGSSGNEASVSNTSGDSEHGGNGNGQNAVSTKSSTEPPVVAASTRPTKLADREPQHPHHPHHRSEHQAPARPGAIAGAAAAATDASGSRSSPDEAVDGGHVLSRPPPLRLRGAVNAADPSSVGATGSSSTPSDTVAHAPPRQFQSPGEVSADGAADAIASPPFVTPSQSSSFVLRTVHLSAQATASAGVHLAHSPPGHESAQQPPPGTAPTTSAAALASSTIATTTTGSSGRGSGKSRGSSIKPKPFVCDQCGTGFSRFQNLKSHMLTHQNVRPFGCDECGQAFSRLHDLKRHQRLHTGARPFTCPNCFRSFARLDALNRHRDSNSCQNVNLPQSLRDVALAAAGMSNLAASGAAAGNAADTQEASGTGAAAAAARKRGRPTRAQAAAALSTSAAHNTNTNSSGSNNPNNTADSNHASSSGNKRTGVAGSNNASASPPGANGNRSSADSRPATSVSNSIVPSDSVSQQHARRGGGGQRNHNQSSDSSDGPRPLVPPPFPLQHPGLLHQNGGAAAADGLRDESPMDLVTPFGTLDGEMLDGRAPGRDLINAATESWRAHQRQFGGPPAMGPGPALQMWGSPPLPLYAAGRAAATSSQFASVSASPQGHGQQQDMASPLFQASMGSLDGGASGRKRRRGTSTSPVVGGTPPDSQQGQEVYLQQQQQLMHASMGMRRSRTGLGSGEHSGGVLFADGPHGMSSGRDMDVETFEVAAGPAPNYVGRERPSDQGRWASSGHDFAPPGAYYRNAASQQQQPRQAQALERGTPPQAGVVMSSSSGANQSGSAQTSTGSSAHVKGSTRSGGPMPAPNPLPSSLGQHQPYQSHQAQSVDATVAAGAGDTSADGTPQPHGTSSQHLHPSHHPGLEVMHRRLDMLMQDNLWLRSRIVDLEHQSQADRIRIMEQDDQIRALLMERNMLRSGSQEPSSGTTGMDGSGIVPGPPPSAGNSGHSSRAIPQAHGRSSSFLTPPSHGRFYDPGPYAHSPPQQFYADEVYGYPPTNTPGGSHASRWSASRGYPDLSGEAYRHHQLAPPPSTGRLHARHAGYYGHQLLLYSHPSHPQYDPRDVAAPHAHPQLQYPRFEDAAMDGEMEFTAMAHPPKRRRVMSSGPAAEGDLAGAPGGGSGSQLH